MFKATNIMEPNCPLTMVEAYNVGCNNWAKVYTCKASQSNTMLGNPAIPLAQPHLKIAGKIICHKTMEAIWHAVNLPPYCQYLCNKPQWTKKNDCNVHWAVLHLSISAFQPSDQQQLVLFINDKLPLWASPAHPHHGLPLCLSCRCINEDLARQQFFTKHL